NGSSIKTRRRSPISSSSGVGHDRGARHDAPGRSGGTRPHPRVARREHAGRGGGGHRQDERAGGAPGRRAGRGTGQGGYGGRRDLHGKGGRGAEAAFACRAREGPPERSPGFSTSDAARRGGGAPRGGAREHDPRFLQRSSPRAPG